MADETSVGSFRGAVMDALRRRDLSEMELRELVRHYVEDLSLPEDDAYRVLRELHAGVSDDRTDELLSSVMDCLVGYCAPAMRVGRGIAPGAARSR